MANNKIKGLTVEIGGDTTKLSKALEGVEQNSRDLSQELGEINKLLKMDPKNTELLTQKQKVLGDAVSNTKEKLDKLKEAEKQVQAQFAKGEASEEQVRALQREIIATENKLNGYEKAVKETKKALKGMGDQTKDVEKSSDGLGQTLANVAKTGLAALATSVTAVIGAMVGSAEATREYRTAMGKLDTAFTTSGHSSEAAKNTYAALQGILGDTDQAVEASNHLAKLAQNEEDLANWTNIATGVYATFGDSLPIENLTEAANETAKTGAITGGLADALNWAGVSEDEFQAKLDACNNEQERQALIVSTLSGLYSDAADKYRETNAEVIRANQANEAWASSMAAIGGVIEPILTDIKMLGASMLSNLVPGVQAVAAAFRGLLNGDDGAAANLGAALTNIIQQLLTKVTELAPTLLTVATSLIATLAESLLLQLPVIFETLLTMIGSVAESLAELLPVLIPIAISAVVQLVETLLDNIDMLIDAGILLLLSLADGLIAALPDLIEKIPVIIDKTVTAITRNLPKILEAGIQLIIKLAEGLIKAVPQLVAKLPEIITSIVKGLANGLTSIVNVGKNLVEGLWNGIKNATGWVLDKIKGFGDSILGGIKSFFGIKSPSRVFRDVVGKNLALGLAEGIEDNADAPLDAMTSLGDDLLGEADAVNGLTLERQLNHTFAGSSAAAQAQSDMLSKLDSILAAIERGQILTIDGSALVGATAGKMDSTLGQRRALAARGAL